MLPYFKSKTVNSGGLFAGFRSAKIKFFVVFLFFVFCFFYVFVLLLFSLYLVC